jgi:hypothetical protein
MEGRKEFWANCWQQTTPLSIDKPYCKAFQLKPENLQHLNEQVFKIIYGSMDKEAQSLVGSAANHDQITDWLSNTKIFSIDVVNQLDKFMELEARILQAFKEMNFINHVNAIQLPVDIRIVHPVPPPNYLEKRKAVDFMHTDGWRGEPPDVVNCVLYCVAGDKTSQLVVYDVPEGEIDKFEAYEGDEREACVLTEELPEVAFRHIPGETVFFDAYTPHHTRRNGDEVRISLNFSFRRGDPYEVFDERWDRSQQNWSKYWTLPQEQAGYTFETRCDQELKKLIAAGHTEAIEQRKSAVEKLRVPRKLEELYAG